MKNWWFKFDFKVWRTDSELRECSLETKGFWVEVLCVMHEKDTYQLTGSYERLSRLLGCSTNEVARCVVELQSTKTADVTIGHGDVTIKSRRLERELKAKEGSKLRKQKERGHGDVTPKSHDRVKSKELEVRNKKEEEEAHTPEPKPENQDAPRFGDSPFTNPALILYEERFGLKVGNQFAKEVFARVKNLGVWESLLSDKAALADGSLDERKKIARWILTAYDERMVIQRKTESVLDAKGFHRTDIKPQSKWMHDC